MACPLNQIILQDVNGDFWSVTVDDNGLLSSTSAIVGPGQTYVLESPVSTYWILGVTTNGLLTTTQTASTNAVGLISLLSPDNLIVNLEIDANGLLQTISTGIVYNPALNLPLSFLRQIPSHLLVDLIANPAFTDCTRQNAANLLTGRQITYFPYWKNYFLGFQGPAPTDPITGMISVREAEDPQFLYYMNNAVPII